MVGRIQHFWMRRQSFFQQQHCNERGFILRRRQIKGEVLNLSECQENFCFRKRRKRQICSAINLSGKWPLTRVYCRLLQGYKGKTRLGRFNFISSVTSGTFSYPLQPRWHLREFGMRVSCIARWNFSSNWTASRVEHRHKSKMNFEFTH